MVLFESKFVKIEYTKSNKQVIQKWEDLVPSPVFREAIDATVHFLKENEVYTIISDTTRQSVVKPEDAEYAASVIPEMYSYGLKAMAFIIPEDVFTKLSLSKFANARKDENIEYFANLSEAKLWLSNKVRDLQ